nr:pseudouridine synthase [uncultured Blautia sp.]
MAVMGKMRLDKYLADMGLGTRSEVKKFLKGGQVTVNGGTVTKPEFKVDPDTDEILASGEKVAYEDFEYYMLNKPQGVVSATEDSREKTVLDCIVSKKRKDLFPVGRLDKDTEGLLLITNDGALAHRLLSPKKHVDKTYFVRLRENLSQEDSRKLCEGVDIGEVNLTMPADITGFVPGDRQCCITIREGKFHQVKRMFASVGNEVVYLKRLSMGPLILDEGLKPGQYRKLSAKEIERLKNNA